VADIFVSYTSCDRDWAFWIGHELEKLGHTPRIHEWEIPGGGNIIAWMEERHHNADHILCVISNAYLKAPYSSWERQAAQWAAASKRPNFALPVFVEDCEAPTLLAAVKRCDLHGIDEDEARVRLKAFLAPADKPSGPVRFPGGKPSVTRPAKRAPAAFPGLASSALTSLVLSNIPISVPRHFLGRDDDLAAIDAALKGRKGRAAITTLHGMRGVGKSTLAAAYAERHRDDYRATWWIRAQTESTMRADLVSLGVRLGWIAAEEKEEPALAVAMENLIQTGDGILLIYDNAINAEALKPFLPRGGSARVLVTSNSPSWRAIASPIEIELWPKEVGADYFIARTGRTAERTAAESLSDTLGGLPLAHEQAASYCEQLGISFAEYAMRFAEAPTKFLDDVRHAPVEHNDRMTVAKSFELAIDEATKLHSAAEQLIVYAALLAPEPIPLFLFTEGPENFPEPFALALAEDGLDEAVAALRAFALVDRETIVDERYESISTDCIRLHRLVRQVAQARCIGAARDSARRALLEAVAAVCPTDLWRDPNAWLRFRRVDAIVIALVESEAIPLNGEGRTADLLIWAGQYRQYALAAYAEAKLLYERALSIRETLPGSKDFDTAVCLTNLALLLKAQADFKGALPLYERALAITEEVFGPENPHTASTLNNLAVLVYEQGDFVSARNLHERALAIRERELGAKHPETAGSLVGLGAVCRKQGDLTRARLLFERAVSIDEASFGRDHPEVATDLMNFAGLLWDQGDHAGAGAMYERALEIRENTFGPDHPETAVILNDLALLLQAQGDLARARALFKRALAIREKVLGPAHPFTATTLNDLAILLQAEGDNAEARLLFERALKIREKVLGPEHPNTARVRANLAALSAH
jgi:tetratricopeptide (TPR) repeat protein